MHLRTTFFLLVLSVLFASFILFDHTSDNSDETEKSTKENKLLDFDPEQMVFWSFASDKYLIECNNENGQWMIAKPLRTRAKDAQVNYMLSVLSALRKCETITEDQRRARALTLADYGLEKPRVRIVIGSPDQRMELNVGNLSPLKDSLYVQINTGSTVVATTTNLLAIIPSDLDDIRDKRLLAGAPAYVKKLEIKRLQSPLIQVVKEGPEWVVRKPVVARADWLKISSLLDGLFNAQIEQYVTDTMTDPALYGLSEDEAVLLIGIWQNENENGEYLLFGKNAREKEGRVYAALRGQNSVFTVQAEVVNALAATLGGIRDSRLFFMAPDSFASIRIEEENNLLRLVRDANSGWQIIEPKKWKADVKTVEYLIARLNSLRVDAFLPGADPGVQGLEKPAKIIAVSDTIVPLPGSNQPPGAAAQAGATTRTLFLSAPVHGQEYVFGRFNDEAEIYQLSASAVATISINPMMYRDSSVLLFDPAAVRNIIMRKNNFEQIVLRDDNGVWRPGASTPGAQVNLKTIDELLARAGNLHAARFERCDGGDAAVYGLQPAPITLTFLLSGEEGISKTLCLGENSEDKGVYAMLQGQDVVFVLDRELADLLTRDILGNK